MTPRKHHSLTRDTRPAALSAIAIVLFWTSAGAICYAIGAAVQSVAG